MKLVLDIIFRMGVIEENQINMVTKKITRRKSKDKLPGVVLLDQVGIVNELYLLIQ